MDNVFLCRRMFTCIMIYFSINPITLRRSAIADVNTIDKFINSGMDMLSTRPQTVSTNW